MCALLISLVILFFPLITTNAKSPSPLSWEQTLINHQAADNARQLYLSNLASVRPIAPIASAWPQSTTFIVKANIGTPPQSLNVAIDTSSDAAWFSSSSCIGCPNVAFNPARSSTFKTIPCGATQCNQVPNPSCISNKKACGFNWAYGSSRISAFLAEDSLDLFGNPISKYTFGCVQTTTGTSFPVQGLLGLGRGPLSLISQTRKLYNSTFSYCLPHYNSPSFTGSLKLGQKFQPVHINYTPLLNNPKRPSLYYVNLVAIRVGIRVLNITSNAFAFDSNTGGGTIFDSGTMFTTLVNEAYEAVRNEVRRRQNAPTFSLGGFDTCYKTTKIVVPTITFMFPGMNTTLAQENFIIRSSSGSISCLAMGPAKGGNSALNVIASFQQTNHRILIDGMNSRLGVSREPCSG